jgi:Cytosine deaminase and related metal-dependent hydrolases
MSELREPMQVDLLVTGAQVVCFDDVGRTISDGAIGIVGTDIAWIGRADDAAIQLIAKETLRAEGMIAMPGFIDCHVHTAQQFLHGKIQSIQRRGELRQPMWQVYLVTFESCLTPEDVYASGLACYGAMLRSGTTCFLEAGGPHPDEMGRAADEIGIRGRIAQSTMDTEEDLPPNMRCTTDQALKRSEQLVGRWRNHPRVNAWLALRQLLVNTEELRLGMRDLSHALDVPIHSHLNEGTYEIDYTVAKYGLRPTEYLESIGCLDRYVHAAHSVLMSNKDLDLYKRRNVSACHCALNNYRIGVPRLVDMMERGIRVGLGTDGAGTRCSLDMFQVVHGAVLGQQTIYGTPQHHDLPVSHEQMLRQALTGGAAAAGMSPEIGSLEVGKRADIVLVSTSDPDQFPAIDPVITLAESVVGRDVHTVLVDGKIVLHEGKLTQVNLERTQQYVLNRYEDLMRRYDEVIP